MTIKTTLDIDNSENNKKDLLKHNIQIIIVYSLFLTIAFTLHTLVIQILIKISGKKEPHIFLQFIYLIILIFLMVLFTYIFNINFKI